MLMMLPLPWACMARTSCFMLRTTPRTLVSNVAAKLSAVWSVIGPPWPSVAALFTATSRRPNRATVLSTRVRTSSSLRTSALMNSASEPNERNSLTSALPASSRRPATTTFAPFLAKATAAARPMPVKAPVINTTGLLICDPRNLLPYRESMKCNLRPRPLETASRCWRLHFRPCSVHGARSKYFVSLGACLEDMEEHHGATAPSLFHRDRRRGQPDARGKETTAHGAAFPQPPDPRSRTRGWRRVDEPQRARHRVDRRRQGLTRPRPAGADSGGGGCGGGAASGETAADIVCDRLPLGPHRGPSPSLPAGRPRDRARTQPR